MSNLAEGMHEDELRTVGTIGELTGGNRKVSCHHIGLVLAVGLISGRVERVFNGLSETRVALEVGVVDEPRHRVVGILLRHERPISIGLHRFVPTRIEQEELIIDIGHFLKLGIFALQPLQGLCGQGEVLQFVFLNESGVVEAVLYDVVASRLRLWCERNLLQIELSRVWVFGNGVSGRRVCRGICGLGRSVGVADGIVGGIVIFVRLRRGQNRAV